MVLNNEINLNLRNSELVVVSGDVELLTFHNPSFEKKENSIVHGNLWIEVGPECYQSSEESFVCRLSVHNRGTHVVVLTLNVEFLADFFLSYFLLGHQIHANNLYYLTRNYEWSELNSRQDIDSLTPGYLIGSVGRAFIHLQYSQHGLLELLPSGKVDLYLDHSATHPRIIRISELSHNRSAYRTNKERKLSCQISIYLIDNTVESHIPILWRYPGGNLACFVITDHADFDNTQKLAALYTDANGINSTRVRTTKSVFWSTCNRSTPGKLLHPDGLDNPRYRKLIDQISYAGHEICPHSIVLRPTPNEPVVPMTSVYSAVKYFARNYQSGTWIDHGRTSRQPINYSQKGWDQTSDWNLIDLLRDFGFNNLWSSYDVSDYPIHHINQFDDSDSSAEYFSEAVREILGGKILRGINYLNHASRRALRDDALDDMDRIRRIIKISTSGNIRLIIRLRNIVKEGPKLPIITARLIIQILKPKHADIHGDRPLFPTIFCEKGLPIGQVTEDDLVLFASSAVNIYSTSWRNNIGKLIDQNGMHISHTYLCADLKHAEPAVIEKGNRKYLSTGFIEILQNIDSLIQDNRLWNPTMKELAAWYKSLFQVQIYATGSQNLTIENRSNRSIEGFCLLFPPSTKKVHLDGWEIQPIRRRPLLYSFDIPARSQRDLLWATQ